MEDCQRCQISRVSSSNVLIIRGYPLVNVLHSYGKSTFFDGKVTLSMASFNRYFSPYQRISCLATRGSPGCYPMQGHASSVSFNATFTALERGSRWTLALQLLKVPSRHGTCAMGSYGTCIRKCPKSCGILGHHCTKTFFFGKFHHDLNQRPHQANDGECKVNHPKMVELFRLVKCCNLPRNMCERLDIYQF